MMNFEDRLISILLERKGWREWPIDPEDESKGVLRAQKQSQQQGVKRGRPHAAGVKRTEVEIPGPDKSKQKIHTTAKPGLAKFNIQSVYKDGFGNTIQSLGGHQSARFSEPKEIKRRHSVKGKIGNRQVNVRDTGLGRFVR
jgi:hypothetical protein